MSVFEIVGKYGFLGFCRKAKVRIPYTVSNIVLCAGCPEFEDLEAIACHYDARRCFHGYRKGGSVCAGCSRSKSL